MKTLSFFLISFFIYSGYAQPLIHSIQIQTHNHSLKDSIEKNLSKYRNKPLNPQTLSQIKKNIAQILIRQKIRNSILRGPQTQIQKDKAKLIFEIDNPYRYEFIFKNNQKIDSRYLLQALDFKNLFTQPNFIQNSQEKIKNYYLSKGFNEVHIESSIISENKKFLRKVVFTIQEGPRFKLRHLKFTNSHSKKETFYRDLFFSNASALIKSRFYVEKDFNLTLKKIIAHLRKNGFLNAEVIHVNKQTYDNNIDVEVFIKEGKPITVRKISIQGNTLFSSDEIKKIIGIQEQNILNLENWEEGLSRLTLKYYNQGYLDFEISQRENLLHIEKSLQAVDIHIPLREGKKTLVSEIEVKGNQEVATSFIVHTSSLRVGTHINRQDLIRAQDFINDLQMFSNVQVYHETLNEKTKIIIEVKERLFRFLRFRAGANFERAQIPVEYIEKRFLGNDASEFNLNYRFIANYDWMLPLFMDTFQSQDSTLESIWSRRNLLEYDFLTGYKHYYLGNTYFNLVTSYSRHNSIFTLPENPDESSEWLSSHKFLLSLEKKFSLDTILTLKLLELDLNESRTIENFQNISARETQILSLSGLSFYMDRRNNIFYPTSGQYFTSILDYSGPPLRTDSNIHFIRLDSNYSFYIPLFSGLVLVQSIHGGYIHTFKEIPVTYMFFLGGPDSIRGYDEEFSGDLISSQYSNIEIENANSTFNESSFYFLTKSEIRFPLYEQLKGAFFYDGGSIYLMKENPELQSYLHSVGLSLHYSLLVMNIGFKLNPFHSFPNENLEENIDKLFVQFQIGSF